MVLRRIAAGIGLFVLAALVIAVPALDVSIPFTTTQQLIVVGLVVVFASIRYLNPTGSTSEPTPPAPEGPADLPEPGENVEDQLETLSQNPLRPNAKRNWKETHDELRTHLRSVAVSTLMDRYNLSEAEAESLIESREWSDDPVATVFFTSGYTDDEPSLLDLRNTTSQSRIGKQAKHAIDELGEIERGTRLLPGTALADREDESGVTYGDDRQGGTGEGGESP